MCRGWEGCGERDGDKEEGRLGPGKGQVLWQQDPSEPPSPALGLCRPALAIYGYHASSLARAFP